MNGKIIAVIAVVAVVVIAGAGVGIYFLLKDKGGDPETDYTLIDSTSNIKAGMTIKEKTESSKQNSDVTYKVTKVVPSHSLRSSRARILPKRFWIWSNSIPINPRTAFTYSHSTTEIPHCPKG